MDWADIAVKASALLGAGYFLYLAGKYGLGPLWTKLVGVGAAAKADLVALEARVTGLEVATGITTPVASPVNPTPKPAVKPVPVAAAPVAPPAA
jgi:hypothetical protein